MTRSIARPLCDSRATCYCYKASDLLLRNVVIGVTLSLLVIHFIVVSRHQLTRPLTSVINSPWYVAAKCILRNAGRISNIHDEKQRSYNGSLMWTVPAASAIHLAATYRGEFITLVSGRVSWWRETTMKCMTRRLNVMPMTTLRSSKSEAL